MNRRTPGPHLNCQKDRAHLPRLTGDKGPERRAIMGVVIGVKHAQMPCVFKIFMILGLLCMIVLEHLRRTQCQRSNQNETEGDDQAQLDATKLERHTIEYWANKHPRGTDDEDVRENLPHTLWRAQDNTQPPQIMTTPKQSSQHKAECGELRLELAGKRPLRVGASHGKRIDPENCHWVLHAGHDLRKSRT